MGKLKCTKSLCLLYNGSCLPFPHWTGSAWHSIHASGNRKCQLNSILLAAQRRLLTSLQTSTSVVSTVHQFE